MPRTNQTRPSPGLPPTANVPKDAGAWDEFFYKIYSTLYDGDAARFPRVSVSGKDGSGTFSADKNMFQDLLSLDCGLYSDYTSDNGNIIYGYAANVRRSAGDALVVGAQINAWGPTGGRGGVFGIATTAVGAARFGGSLVGMETTPANFYDDNRAAKIGLDAVFKNRFDGATFVNGVGADRYNYYSSAHWITSQPRSSTGEMCGWTRGISFLGECLDTQTPPAWNAAVTYSAGMVVSSGGVLWQAIQTSLNQVPAVPSLFWVQHTAAGVVAGAIGIDFSSLPLTAMGRISSAIRLRDTMRIDFDVTGAVGMAFDAASSVMQLVMNGAVTKFGVNVTSGQLYLTRGVDALGGGAGATLGAIGGTGPTTAAQNSWIRCTHDVLGDIWLPIWI